MSEEARNEMAVIQVTGAIGSASYQSKFITNRDDARKVIDAFLHAAHKLSQQHGLPLSNKSESAKIVLKS